jgi:hypothetical protein
MSYSGEPVLVAEEDDQVKQRDFTDAVPQQSLGIAELDATRKRVTCRLVLSDANTNFVYRIMLRARLAQPRFYVRLARGYASSPSPHALVFLEHRAGKLDAGSLSALTAARQLGGEVTGLILGAPDEVKSAVESAKK